MKKNRPVSMLSKVRCGLANKHPQAQGYGPALCDGQKLEDYKLKLLVRPK
jgi:hypothetical protein